MGLVLRLMLSPDNLDSMPAESFRALSRWVSETILNETILTPESWMEIAFHLNKQRWDSGIDWLDEQPMTRIKRMIEINQKVAEDQREELKRSGKGGR